MTGDRARRLADLPREADLRGQILCDDSVLGIRNAIDEARGNGVGRIFVPPRTGGYIFNETVLVDGPLEAPLEIIFHPKARLYAPNGLRGAFINIPDCGKQRVLISGGYMNADDQTESDEGAGESWAMIMLQNYGTGSKIWDMVAKAGDDYRYGKGDTWLFDQGFGLLVDNIYLIGFTDFAIYSSGNGAGINGKGTKVTNCTFEGVYGAAVSKRLGEDNRYFNNTIRNSLHGFASAPAGPLGGGPLVAPGKRLSLIGNRYYDVRTPLYFPWADGLVAIDELIRGYGYDLDGNRAGTAAALHLLGTHGAEINLRILNTGNDPDLHGVLLGEATINGVTRTADHNDIHVTADGGAGGGRAVFEQAGDHNNITVSARGTWTTPAFKSGGNSQWDVSNEADNSRRIGFGTSDKIVITPTMVTISPGTGGSTEVQRPGVPAQHMRIFGDGSANHIRSTSAAHAAKPIVYECNADGEVTDGELGHEFKVQGDRVAKITPTGMTGPGDVPYATIADLSAITLTPLQFGAVGLGTGNDGPALNAMFASVRAILAANPHAIVIVNGGNRLYRTTDSINVTNLAAWNLTVSSLYLIGACTGKAVIDAIGTRGYTFEGVGIWGEKANRPAAGFQAQRGTAGGFCDNASFKECFTDGYFTRTATHDYGQETTTWDHCTIYNRDHTGRVAIHEGYDGHPMTSDYAAIMTGGTSFINKQFTNCDWRYLPADENIAAITGVSKAANAVITAPGHAFQIGDEVVFQYVGGMVDMFGRIGTVTARTTNTLTVNVNTTAMADYTGGGNVIRRAEQSPVYVSRTEGFAGDSCYVVSYGRPPIEVGFPDPAFLRVEHLHFPNILFEGAGQSCEIFFDTIVPVSVQGFTLTTYNSHAFDALIGCPGGGDEIVQFYSPRIESFDPMFNIPLVDAPAAFAAYGAYITHASLALVAFADWAAFTGSIMSISTGKTTLIVGDALYLNEHKTKLVGTFGTGAAVPTLGANKPGTTSDPATWMDVEVEGVTYCYPLWSKT